MPSASYVYLVTLPLGSVIDVTSPGCVASPYVYVVVALSVELSGVERLSRLPAALYVIVVVTPSGSVIVSGSLSVL